MAKEKYLECGKIINTHGVRGVVKVESYCDTPRVLAELPAVYRKKAGEFIKYDVIHASLQKQFVLLTLNGLDTLEKAIEAKNEIIYADRDDFSLSDGGYFIVDLIGLPLVDPDSGEKYGVLIDVINSGASDIYVVKTENGEAMIPAVPEFIKNIDLDNAIYIKPIPGMFD